MVMSGRCLHFMGLLPNIRMSYDTQNDLHKYDYPSKPIRLRCMDGLTKSLFLGRLRLERLTSKDDRSVVKKLCLETQAAHLFLLGPNGQGPIFPPTTLKMGGGGGLNSCILKQI